jgi:hypothetical protein
MITPLSPPWERDRVRSTQGEGARPNVAHSPSPGSLRSPPSPIEGEECL